jgi:hypothetical protein
VLLDCFGLALFFTSRIEYYHVFDLVSILAYFVKFVNFGPIAVFKIHRRFANFGLITIVDVKRRFCQFWAHCHSQRQASILPVRLIAVVNVKHRYCQLWAHCRR